MVQINSGRYSEPKHWPDRLIYESKRGQSGYACRECGQPAKHPFTFYCRRTHKKKWEKEHSPPVWGYVRTEILKRDNHTCQLCGVTQEELSAAWKQVQEEHDAKWRAGYRKPYLKDINWYDYQLEVDHILPVKTHPELEFDRDNCRTLCHPCHVQHGARPQGPDPLEHVVPLEEFDA